jgi:hypothetical protein
MKFFVYLIRHHHKSIMDISNAYASLHKCHIMSYQSLDLHKMRKEQHHDAQITQVRQGAYIIIKYVDPCQT